MAMELDVGQSILLVAGEGEVIGDAEDRRVEILCDRDELCVTWTRFGPGRDGADPHVHRHHTDLFYVFDGVLTVGLGTDRQETAAPAGSLVIAPPLVVHAFRNASPTEELRYLHFHAPSGGFADYLRGRQTGFDSEDPPADGGRSVEEALIVTAEDGPLLVDREEIRIEVRDAPGPASNRLTCLYALEDGGLLEIRA
jgi:mannose-6-phosphate isomerase-like protein (cupin superfamily)